MSIQHLLNAIEQVVLSMTKIPNSDRIHAYATVKVLSDECLEEAKKAGKPAALIDEIVVKLLTDCRTLAGLEDRGGHPDSNLLTYALGEIKRFRSVYAFDVKR
jgi:hypothetical protein